MNHLQRSAKNLAEREFSVSGAFWAPMVVGLIAALAWRYCT